MIKRGHPLTTPTNICYPSSTTCDGPAPQAERQTMRLTICGTAFDLPEAFQEGHSCTFAEAQFLEAERGRRIQDLLARRGASLTQAEVEAFAVTWKFEPRAAAAA